jgi:type IV secretion system protein VirB9
VTQIMVKPTESGLTTNLVITTNRRTYSMKLVSREQEWMPLVSFAYPEDSQAKWVAFQASQERQREATTLSSGEDIAKLDFNYRMSGDDPAWKPLRVYSNGVKTFIQFPASVSHAELPTLVALGTDGDLFTSPSQRLVNYRLIGDRFEVDQVLANAALIAGVGGEQERVSIAHLGGHNGTP